MSGRDVCNLAKCHIAEGSDRVVTAVVKGVQHLQDRLCPDVSVAQCLNFMQDDLIVFCLSTHHKVDGICACFLWFLQCLYQTSQVWHTTSTPLYNIGNRCGCSFWAMCSLSVLLADPLSSSLTERPWLVGRHQCLMS